MPKSPDLVVVAGHRFPTYRGIVHMPSNVRAEFYRRYQDTFPDIAVMGRVAESKRRPDTAPLEGVRFIPLPNFTSTRTFVGSLPRIAATVFAQCPPDSAYILRVPDVLSQFVGTLISLRHNSSYALEIVADPLEAVLNTRHFTRPVRLLIGRAVDQNLRFMIRRASGVSFVSETLSEQYGLLDKSAVYSSVVLPDELLLSTPRERRQGPLRLIVVASLEQPYKGLDTLIEAVALIRQGGIDASLSIIGDGRLKADLVATAQRHGVAEVVQFLGYLPPDKVFQELDKHDMFVLLSRTEGLPRAMIEAMARGLPCVGTGVGAIPELLSTEQLVTPDRPMDAAKAVAAAADPEVYASLSARSILTAQPFSESVLTSVRDSFYREYAASASASRTAAPIKGNAASPLTIAFAGLIDDATAGAIATEALASAAARLVPVTLFGRSAAKSEPIDASARDYELRTQAPTKLGGLRLALASVGHARATHGHLYTRHPLVALLAVIRKVPAALELHHPETSVLRRLATDFLLTSRRCQIVAISEGLAGYAQARSPRAHPVRVLPSAGTLASAESMEARRLRLRASTRLKVAVVTSLDRSRRQTLDLDRLIELTTPEIDWMVIGRDRIPETTEGRDELGVMPPAAVRRHLLDADLAIAPYASDTRVAGGAVTGSYMSPLKVAEYLAAGIPTLATDLPACRFLAARSNGMILVPDNDLQTWVVMLQRAAADRDHLIQLAECAQEYAEREGNWTSRARSIMDLWG